MTESCLQAVRNIPTLEVFHTVKHPINYAHAAFPGIQGIITPDDDCLLQFYLGKNQQIRVILLLQNRQDKNLATVSICDGYAGGNPLKGTLLGKSM